MKVWIKIIKGEKITKDFTYTPEKYNDNELHHYLEIVCNELDEPTPIVLRKHLAHIKEFGNTAFKELDFVETIHFDKMVVEIFDDKPKKDTPKA